MSNTATIAPQGSKIAIADDDHDIVNLLCYILEREGYDLVMGHNGKDVLRLIESEKPDLVILDIMMPGMDGFDVCRRIRQNPLLRAIPVLMLTALSEEKSEVEGLEAGADAYLPKPIAPRRLLSHVRALLRRVRRDNNYFGAPLTTLRIADLVVDRDQYVIRRMHKGRTKEIVLPRKEFELLFFMASHPGRVFSRQELLNEVWDANVFVMDRTIDVHISKIREKLKPGYIETVKGVGYRFKA